MSHLVGDRLPAGTRLVRRPWPSARANQGQASYSLREIRDGGTWDSHLISGSLGTSWQIPPADLTFPPSSSRILAKLERRPLSSLTEVHINGSVPSLPRRLHE
jgi:hypothetical protein